jgi:hypothetical protein
MAKSKKQLPQTEKDSTYFLKLVLYMVVASFWLKFPEPLQLGDFTVYGIPLGLFIGLLFATHDHFQIDRKIEYALLIIVTIITFYVPAGIVV